MGKSEENICRSFNGGIIECEKPNEFLYKFEGNLTLTDGAVIPLNVDMMMLRGSSLRNTEWVYGVAVFTGHETKVMRNSTNSKAKKSKIEKATDKYILVTILIQTIMSLIAGCISAVFLTMFAPNDAKYLEYPVTS